MTSTDPNSMLPPGEPSRPRRTLPSREELDSESLDRVASMTSLCAILLGFLVALAVTGLVLGIIAYDKVDDRLDSIEHFTGRTAQHLNDQADELPPPGMTP